MDSPGLRRGLVRLPLGSERVLDADEEVFILYSRSTSATPNERGLGFLDSHSDVLTLNFELKSPSTHELPKRKSTRKSTSRPVRDKTIEIQLAQDKTALRSRAGDTGSVVWRASIDFAQLILQQQHAKSPVSIFDESLRDARVLELGSGTGLLSIALSPLVSHYTATDIQPLLPLIRKNLALNFSGWSDAPSTLDISAAGQKVSVDELDWQSLHSTPPARRTRLFPLPSTPFDLVLVVDCIYHPALLPSLLTTLDYVTSPGSTTVVVIMELRAEDVTRQFLEGWLSLGEWEVWRIGSDEFTEGMLAPDTAYVTWVGWKDAKTAL
ncbi:putative methyltransferase-domain-containing protein [Mycena vitilis]|nr:putative methyltransferase-domain-containing protein [Mycena vitilis]